MTLTWTRGQRAALAVVQERWRLPIAHSPTYAPREIELARRDAARERVRRRQRLARQLTTALGWSDTRSAP